MPRTPTIQHLINDRRAMINVNMAESRQLLLSLIARHLQKQHVTSVQGHTRHRFWLKSKGRIRVPVSD